MKTYKEISLQEVNIRASLLADEWRIILAVLAVENDKRRIIKTGKLGVAKVEDLLLKVQDLVDED